MRALLVLVLLVGVASAQPNARLDVRLDDHVGARIPRGLTFTDSARQSVALGSLFDGKRPVVLVMAYARCTMLCSVVLRSVASAISTTTTVVPGKDYVPVVVSLDPQETPNEGASRQNRLLSEIGHPGDRTAWPYLVGDDASIHELAATLGFHYAWDPTTQQYAHPAVVFVLTPDGRIAEYLRGVTFDELGPAVLRARTGQVTPSAAHDLLTCFHFDPALRRYERKISLLYRLGAGVVLATLAAIIATLIYLERRRRVLV